MKDNYEYWVSKMKDEVLGQRASLEMSAGMADPSHLSSYVKVGNRVVVSANWIFFLMMSYSLTLNFAISSMFLHVSCFGHMAF